MNILKTNTILNMLSQLCRQLRLYDVGMGLVKNHADGGNQCPRRKTCPSVNVSTDKPTLTNFGPKPGFCSDKPVTNRRSHGTVNANCSFLYKML